MKKIKEFTMFFGGNPKMAYPSSVFAGYRITSGKATSPQKIFEVPDPDTSMSMEEMWEETLREVKQIEGIA